MATPWLPGPCAAALLAIPSAAMLIKRYVFRMFASCAGYTDPATANHETRFYAGGDLDVSD